MKLVYFASHPVQYHVPLFRALAQQCTFEAWFAHRQEAREQAAAGYGVAFDWDVDLYSGYEHRFLANVARDPSTARFNGCSTPSVVEALSALRPDAIVIGGWHLRCYWQALFAARALGIPAWFRTDSKWRPDAPMWQGLLKRAGYRWPLRLASGFLAAGTASRDYLRDLGIAAARIAIVPHTVDVPRFEMALPLRQPRAGRAAVIGFVGRLVSQKRPVDLLDAVAGITREPVRCVIVGDGPEREALRQHARRVNVDVDFAGFCNQAALPAKLAGIDVLALPSVDDTWGLVVNEALAAGAAAVVSDAVGCAPDLGVDPAVVGIHRCGAVDSLRDALQAALDSARSETFDSRRRALVASFAPARAAALMLDSVGRLT